MHPEFAIAGLEYNNHIPPARIPGTHSAASREPQDAAAVSYVIMRYSVMSTFDRLTDNLSRTWDNLALGWQQLRERAGAALTRFHPSSRHSELETRDERLLRHASRWGLLTADVRETANDIRVRLEIPGMEPDQFDIQVSDGVLYVRGEKHLQRETQEGRFHVFECAYGGFERAIQLPADVDDNAARAHYRRGVLDITLPKTPHSQRQRIEVKG